MKTETSPGPVSGASDAPFHLYFNLIPESLVASMLPPDRYGSYLAVGVSGRSRGQAIFFEVDPAKVPSDFPLEEARQRCRPGPGGGEKNSVYLAIYRVLERLPLDALGTLHLTTDDGRVLGLEPSPFVADTEPALHLYQEFVPVKTRVLSRLAPPDFRAHLTHPGQSTYLPKLVFAEMVLPASGQEDAGDVPYSDLAHLRDCITRMECDTDKLTKLVSRHFREEVLFRTVRNGYFVGDADTLLYYPMPSREELEALHHNWWRSAQTLHIR